MYTLQVCEWARSVAAVLLTCPDTFAGRILAQVNQIVIAVASAIMTSSTLILPNHLDLTPQGASLQQESGRKEPNKQAKFDGCKSFAVCSTASHKQPSHRCMLPDEAAVMSAHAAACSTNKMKCVHQARVTVAWLRAATPQPAAAAPPPSPRR